MHPWTLRTGCVTFYNCMNLFFQKSLEDIGSLCDVTCSFEFGLKNFTLVYSTDSSIGFKILGS